MPEHTGSPLRLACAPQRLSQLSARSRHSILKQEERTGANQSEPERTSDPAVSQYWQQSRRHGADPRLPVFQAGHTPDIPPVAAY